MSDKTVFSIVTILVVLGGIIVVIMLQREQGQTIQTTSMYETLSVEELAQEADIIVKAKLSEPRVRVRKDDIHGKMVLRSFPLKSQQTLKGNVSPSSSVEVRGGIATTEQGEILKHDARQAPDLKVGPEYVLFLRKKGGTVSNDSYRVVTGSQGVYDVDGKKLIPHDHHISVFTLDVLKKRIANSAIEEKTVAWNGLQLEYPTKRIDGVQKTRNELALSAGQDTLTLRMRKTGATPKEYAKERAKDVVSEKRRNSFNYLIDARVAGKTGISFANTEETRGATVVSWSENTLLHISWEASEEKNLQTFRTIQGSILRRS